MAQGALRSAPLREGPRCRMQWDGHGDGSTPARSVPEAEDRLKGHRGWGAGGVTGVQSSRDENAPMPDAECAVGSR